MCYKKPGPRCSNHARTALREARQAWRDNPTEENKEAYRKVKTDYYTTEAGWGELEAKIAQAKTDEAKERLTQQLQDYQDRRGAMLSRYKETTGSLDGEGLTDSEREKDVELVARHNAAKQGGTVDGTPRVIDESIDPEEAMSIIEDPTSSPADASAAFKYGSHNAVIDGSGRFENMWRAMGARIQRATDVDNFSEYPIPVVRDFAESFAANPNTPTWFINNNMAIAIASREEGEVFKAVLDHPNASSDTAGRLAQRVHYVDRPGFTSVGGVRALVNSGKLTEEQMTPFTYDFAAEGVRKVVARSEYGTAKLLDELSNDPRVSVRKLVAENPNTSTETLARLANNSNREVKKAATAALSARGEVTDAR